MSTTKKMSEAEESPIAVTDESGAIDTELDNDQSDGRLDADSTAPKSGLWTPPRLQAYCVDHFLMECQIYHEQENGRYRKLTAHSRGVFLEKKDNKKKKKSTGERTRRQPSR